MEDDVGGAEDSLCNKSSSAEDICWHDLKDTPDTDSTTNSKPPFVRVDRPALHQEDFHHSYGLDDGKLRGRKAYENGFRSLGRSTRRCIRSLRELDFYKLLCSVLPILSWLPRYNWRADFSDDCAAGFTVAVMQVPQGLAYAILANVPPIVGIYTAFFPVIIYVIFGTSRHASMGTFAVISILTSKPIIELCHNHDDDPECAVRVMSTVSFLAGVIMVCLGCLRLGSLNALLTDPIVSGFTTGAGVHVFTSQIKYVLGLTITKYVGPGWLAKSYVELFSSLGKVNYVALLISLICMFLFLGFDVVVKPRLSKYCKFQVPVQFIVVVVGTLISYLLDLKVVADIKVIGFVPTGLPSPELPDFSIMLDVFSNTFTITIIGYVISLSIARIVAAKHGYKVDPNQELIAMGASDIFGCFFQSLPMTASMSRTMVQVSTGGKTLITSAVSVFLLLWVLLFAGPLFSDLPNAILASLIIVSLRGVLVQFTDLVKFGRRSYSEVFVWLATLLSTIFIDIDYGLMIGLSTSTAFLLWWGYYPKVELLGQTDQDDIFIDKNNDISFERGNVAIVRITGNLNLANAPLLEGQIIDLLDKEFGESKNEQPSSIIIDLLCVPHIDPSACEQIEKLHKGFGKKGQTLLYSGIRGNVWRRMCDMKVFSVIPKNQCFPSLQDAIAYHTILEP